MSVTDVSLSAPRVAILAALCVSFGCAPSWRPGMLVLPPPKGLHFVEVGGRNTGICARERGGRVGCVGWSDVSAHVFEEDVDRGFHWTSGVDDASALAIGAVFACALRRNGRVACWGENSGKELGDRAGIHAHQAVDVPGLEGVVAVSAGRAHACAALDSGRVRCWGANASSQLGDGTAEMRPSPVEVPGIEDAVGVAAGSDHTCALRAGGGALCWGENSSGQLGDGSSSSSRTPVAVRGLEPADILVAGWEHSCVRLRRGPVRCWGHNSHGQRGLGGTDWQEKMTEVPLPGPAQELVVGVHRTCVIIAGSPPVCWGEWSGDDPEMDWLALNELSATVRPVASLRGALQIASGEGFTCGVQGSGTIQCEGGLSKYGAWSRSEF